MDKVNIILCTYNGEKYLPQQLDSLLAQSYQNITIFIRDDGSTDRTPEILKDYSQRSTDGIHIKLIEDQDGNQGYVKNFLKTIRASGEAEYYAFCDQDDYWMPDKVERAVAAMQKRENDHCLLYTSAYNVCNGAMKITDHGHVPTPFDRLDVGKALSLYDGGWLLGFTCVINKKLKQLAFDNTVMAMYSHDIWVQAVALGFGGELIYDDKVTALFRRHDATTSIAESGVNHSALAAWKYRWQETFGGGALFGRLTSGIVSYAAAFTDSVISEKDRDFLQRFGDHGYGKKHRLRKLFYPHRLKQSMPVELAWRLCILLGKL